MPGSVNSVVAYCWHAVGPQWLHHFWCKLAFFVFFLLFLIPSRDRACGCERRNLTTTCAQRGKQTTRAELRCCGRRQTGGTSDTLRHVSNAVLREPWAKWRAAATISTPVLCFSVWALEKLQLHSRLKCLRCFFCGKAKKKTTQRYEIQRWWCVFEYLRVRMSNKQWSYTKIIMAKMSVKRPHKVQTTALCFYNPFLISLNWLKNKHGCKHITDDAV